MAHLAVLLLTCRVLWGQVDPSKVTTVEDGALRVWDVAAGTAQQVRRQAHGQAHAWSPGIRMKGG